MKNTMLVLSILLLMPALATAQQTEVNTKTNTSKNDGMRLGIGARIGGYGFREINEDKINWNECRMDGFGLFGTLDLNQHFFLETSIDAYHATGKTVAGGMDRTSLHTGFSGGARFLPNFIISPYVFAGGGPEFSLIRVGDTERAMLLANAFMGLGGEVNLGDFKLGTQLKWLWAGLPTHSHAESGIRHQRLGGSADSEDVVVNYTVAGQAQFFIRYVF